MEPVIKFRLLVSKLTNDEQNHLIQNIIKSFGVEQVISFIFKHFHNKYRMNNAYNDDLQNIMNMISNIIESRNKKESLTESSSKENDESINIDLLPSEIIRECASFLTSNEYINFSKSNRTIYCASNSPLILKQLDIAHLADYHDVDLNRFRFIESLCIGPGEFNSFQSSSYPLQHQFIHLKTLKIWHDRNAYDQESTIKAFINSNIINFAQITTLKCEEFGNKNPYDFDEFIDFLLEFPNVSNFTMDEVELSQFNDTNEEITNVLPKINTLKLCNDWPWSLSNKLINMYHHQLIELQYIEIQPFSEINTLCFSKLRKLVIRFPTYSLTHFIDSIDDLQELIFRSIDYQYKELINAINKSLNKYLNINYVSLQCMEGELSEFVSVVEKGLFESKEMNRKSFVIEFIVWCCSSKETVLMRDIEGYIIRITNILNASEIEDFMLKFGFPEEVDNDGYRYKIIETLNKTYLAVTNDNVVKDGKNHNEIIISNNNCKINGYHSYESGIRYN